LPTTANFSLTLPDSVKRGEIDFNFNAPHLIGLPIVYASADLYSKYCHIYICGTGCDPTINNTATNWLETSRNVEDIFATVGLSYVWGNMTDSERNTKNLQMMKMKYRQ
jgi:hypothetical protein